MKNFSPKAYGPFYLLDQIGKGGTAKVYLGIVQEFFTQDNPQGSMVAIKQLLSKYAREEDFIQCLTSEAKLASILDHPNIVRVLDLGNVGTDYYLSMEWINGKSLFDILDEVRRQKKAIATHYLLYVCQQVAKALNYAHVATDIDGRPMDIVHCDVTPHNVLVSYNGHVKLSDFGIATASKRDDQMNKDTVFGKLHYLAPEHIMLKGFDYRSDIYSFGVMLYEIVTYKRPFHAKNVVTLQEQIKNKVPSFDHAFFDNNPELKEFVAQCLAKDPNDRPASLKGFIDLVAHMPEVAKVTPAHMAKLIGFVLQDTIAEEKALLKDRLAQYIQNDHDASLNMDDMVDLHDDQVIQKTEVIPKNYEYDRTKVFIKDDEPSQGEIGRVALEKKKVVKVLEKPVIVEETTAPPEDAPVLVSSSIDDYVDTTLFDDVSNSLNPDHHDDVLDRTNQEKITKKIDIADEEQPDTNPQLVMEEPNALELDEPWPDPDKTWIEPKPAASDQDIQSDDSLEDLELESSDGPHSTKKISIAPETYNQPEPTVFVNDDQEPELIAPNEKTILDLDHEGHEETGSAPDYLVNSPGAEVQEIVVSGEHPFDSEKQPVRKNRDAQFGHVAPINALDYKENTLRIEIPHAILQKVALVILVVTVLGIGGWTLSKQKWVQNMWGGGAAIETIEVWVTNEQKDKRMFGQTVRTVDSAWVERNLVAPAQNFLQAEHKRLTNEPLPMAFQVKKVATSDPLPADDSLLDPHRVFEAVVDAHKIDLSLPADHIGRLHIHLYPQQDGIRQRYPFQYGGRSPFHQHIVYLPTNQTLQEAQVMIAHQMLRLMNAPILTNSKGYPKFPEGYAEPEKKPLHPQKFGEIMTLMIPQSPTQSYLLDQLSKAQIGPSTAQHIGWFRSEKSKD